MECAEAGVWAEGYHNGHRTSSEHGGETLREQILLCR